MSARVVAAGARTPPELEEVVGLDRQGTPCNAKAAVRGGGEPLHRFRVVYGRDGVTIPVEVEAPDAETAIMRAGMRRAELLYLSWVPLTHRRHKYERLSVTDLGPVG